MNQTILKTYEDIFKTIWDRVVPTLGMVSTSTIFKRAIATVEKKHPIVGQLKVDDTGLSFEAVKKSAGQDEKAIQSAFKELIASLFDILAKLTGKVIVGELLKEVEAYKKKI